MLVHWYCNRVYSYIVAIIARELCIRLGEYCVIRTRACHFYQMTVTSHFKWYPREPLVIYAHKARLNGNNERLGYGKPLLFNGDSYVRTKRNGKKHVHVQYKLKNDAVHRCCYVEGLRNSKMWCITRKIPNTTVNVCTLSNIRVHDFH